MLIHEIHAQLGKWHGEFAAVQEMWPPIFRRRAQMLELRPPPTLDHFQSDGQVGHGPHSGTLLCATMRHDRKFLRHYPFNSQRAPAQPPTRTSESLGAF